MPDIRKTVTVRTKTETEIHREELEKILREKLGFPLGTTFDWNVRWEEFDHVVITHETVEQTDG